LCEQIGKGKAQSDTIQNEADNNNDADAPHGNGEA
jgi:hypothetical protein